MAWARERTIPTERPPFVSEVIANLFADRRIPMAVFSVPQNLEKEGNVLNINGKHYS
jgi:hypothetical protein